MLHDAAKLLGRCLHYRRSRVGQTSYDLRTNASEQSKSATKTNDDLNSIEMVNALTNAAKVGGVLPNAHHILHRIISDAVIHKHGKTQHQNRTSSSFKETKEDIIVAKYFDFLKTFIRLFGQKQVTSKMKAKFARCLEHIGQQGQANVSIPSDYTNALKNLKKRHRRDEHSIDLSIVVTTLNAGSSIQLLLDQINSELPPLAVQSKNFHFEFFCIDRGSTDNTFSVLRKFAQSQKSNFYLMTSKAGEGREFNQATIPFIEGKYVYFLNTGNSYNFTALAESVSYAAANEHDVLILPPPTSLSFLQQEYEEGDTTTTSLSDDNLIWRAVKGLKNRDDSQIQKHAALGLSSLSRPWKQITASKLIFDKNITFGPTRHHDNYLFQSIGLVVQPHQRICTFMIRQFGRHPTITRR